VEHAVVQLKGVGVVVSMLVLLGGLGHDSRRGEVDEEREGIGQRGPSVAVVGIVAARGHVVVLGMAHLD